MSNLQPSFEQENGPILIPMHTSQPANEGRGKCWERDFSEEFPISSVDKKDNEATIIVGTPHLDYKITTHLKDQKMEGESKLHSDKGVLVAKLTFVDGIANGPCTLYDENGALFFEGSFVNGYRQGKGKEYENGIMVCEGYYENGKKLNMVPSDEMPGYWKEYDENGNLKNICKKDKYGRYEGECRFYENGTVIKTSEWHEGIEISLSTSSKCSDEPQQVLNEEINNSEHPDGNSTEHDTGDNKQFEVHKKNGNKFIPLKYMKGYWEELDNEGKIVRICQIDAEGKYSGLSYQYQENQVIRVSLWEKDEERELLKSFHNGIMTEYKDGKKCYSGGYIPSLKLNYPRQGEGEEYDTDGQTLLYKGDFIKGKRDGHGKLFKHSMVVYDGEWKKGMKKFYYYLYLVLTLAFMLFTSAASFIFFNAYVGAIVFGLYITAICFYYNRYAGYIASGLFLIMCCFLINLYAGIIVSLVTAITVSFIYNLFAGLVPTGLVVVAICMNLNTYLGIFALGLFLIYIIFLVVHCCGWKKRIIWSSAIYILSLCTVITMALAFNKGNLVKYIILFAVGILLVLIVSVISGCKKDSMISLISIVMIILVSCAIISLLIHPVQPSYFKYVVISLVGLFLISTTNLIVFEYDWSKIIVLKCAAVIVVSCVIINTAIGSFSVPALKYVSVFASGLLLIIIVSYFTGYNKENIHILLSSSGLITSCCVLVSFLLSSMSLASMKYYLVFLIGMILFFIIYLAVSINRKEAGITLASLVIILVVCGVTDLILASLEVYIFRHITVYVIGILLIGIISWITGCDAKNIHTLIPGSGLIVCCSIATSFLLSSMSFSTMKYYLVFLVGIALFFVIYLFSSIYRKAAYILPAVLCITLVLCTLTDLVLASLEIMVMRYVTVIIIGLILIILLSIFNDCGDKNPHVQISGIGSVTFLSYFICLLLGANGVLFINYIAVMVFCSLFVFMVYFFVSLCDGDLENVGKCAGIAWGIGTFLELIMGSVENVFVRCCTIYLIGILLCVVIFAHCAWKDLCCLSVVFVFMVVFVCSWICMNVGGDIYTIVQTLWSITSTILKYVLGFIILIGCLIAWGSN